MRYSGLSDIGNVREANEDYYEIVDMGYPDKPIFFMLADGMGGHNAGEVASRSAVEYALRYIKDNEQELFWTDSNKIMDSMEKILKESNDALRQIAHANSECDGMGTTFIFACIFNDKMYVCHVGDSRAYIVRKGSITHITQDHSYVEELIKLGQITREQAEDHPSKNVITRAIGIDETVDVDKYNVDLENEDTVVLCTDGLSNELSDSEILDAVANNPDTQNACEVMISKANKQGGEDNITVIVIKL